MRIVWRQRAEQQLQHQLEYLRVRNPSAADRVRERVHLRVARLAEFPESGRPSRRAPVRELIITGTPFVAIYVASADQITVLRFFHMSQNR